MIRNKKTLSMTLIAVLSMMAIMASTSQAASSHLVCDTPISCRTISESHPVAPAQKVTVPGLGTVECKVFNAKYEGTSTANEGVTLKNVEYQECGFLGFAAVVNFGTCDYFLSAPITQVNAVHGTGGVTLGPAGCQVKITVPGCTLTIEGSQEFKSAVTYTDVQTIGKKSELTFHEDTGEAMKVSFSGFFCGSGSTSKGRYQGTFTARATDTMGNPVNLSTVPT